MWESQTVFTVMQQSSIRWFKVFLSISLYSWAPINNFSSFKSAPDIQTEISLDGYFKTLIHTLNTIFYEFVNKTSFTKKIQFQSFFKRSWEFIGY